MTIALNALASHYRFRTTDTLGDKVKAVCWRHSEEGYSNDPYRGQHRAFNDGPSGKMTYLRENDVSKIETIDAARAVVKMRVPDPDIRLQKQVGYWLLGDNNIIFRYSDDCFEEHERLSKLDRPIAIGYFLTGVFAATGKVKDLKSIIEAVFSNDRGYRRCFWKGDEENQRRSVISGMSLYLFEHNNPKHFTHDEIIVRITAALSRG